MRLRAILVSGGLMLAGGAVAQDLPAGDAQRGEGLVGTCRTCHGTDGIAKLLIAPNIAGDPEAYLAAQLVAFRDGQRHDEMMTVVSQSLSDQDIADLAAWYAGHPLNATLTTDPAKAPEQCVSCHGADGISTMDEAPHLAGDSEIYLKAQLEAFRSGARESDIMNAVAAELDDATLAAMAKWYASIKAKAGTPE